MAVPVALAAGSPDPVRRSDLLAEVVGDAELDEEVERLIREEAAIKTTVPGSYRRPSTDKDSTGWSDKATGKRNKGKTGDKLPQSKTPASSGGSPQKANGLPKEKSKNPKPNPVQVPREIATTPPPIEISNRFGVLSGEEGDTDEPLGGAESQSPGAVSRGKEAGPVSGNEKEGGSGGVADEMDTSISRKRERGGDRPVPPVSPSSRSSSDGEGGGRKRAV